MLQCSTCKLNKKTYEFNIRLDRSRGYTYDCKQCMKNKDTRTVQHKNRLRYSWAKNNPEKQKALNFKRNLKTKFNITEQIYFGLLEQQDGKCKICNNIETAKEGNTGKIKNLSVDHCHRTNKIRGLLCHKCNLGLGHFKDNIDFLNSAIEYLTNHLEYRKGD